MYLITLKARSKDKYDRKLTYMNAHETNESGNFIET